MREMNIALILECLRRAAPMSRADLAHMTGLTKATVSSLVRELLEARYVRESGIDVGTKGRPSIQLVLNSEIGCLIGAQLGNDSISVLLADFSAKVLWRHQEAAGSRDQAVVLPRVIACIRAASQYAAQLGRPTLGVGLGVAGLVDVAAGTLVYGANLGWTGVPLRRILEAEFTFPVFVDNDANLAALGESYFGAARGSDFVLLITCGIGVGSGMVLNRRILAGAAGFAGEVGHMTIDPNGPHCPCGSNGCWEVFVSEGSVLRRVQAALASGQESRLAAATAEGAGSLTIPDILEAARRGDAVARAALEETGRYLGLGVANLINVLNPERVVFGGSLSVAHEFLLPAMRQAVRQRALRWLQEATEIVVAAHGGDACLMGGIATVYHRVLSQPIAALRQPAPAATAPLERASTSQATGLSSQPVLA